MTHLGAVPRYLQGARLLQYGNEQQSRHVMMRGGADVYDRRRVVTDCRTDEGFSLCIHCLGLCTSGQIRLEHCEVVRILGNHGWKLSMQIKDDEGASRQMCIVC